MPETYEKEIKVTEPECDLRKCMSIANIMHHAQQMGSDHIARYGLNYNQMQCDGMVFVVAKQQITLNRRPTFGETLRLVTTPRAPKGVQFIRDTTFETLEGERLVEVNIAWVLVDPITHKILRPSVFDRYGFAFFPNDGETISGYRIKKPEGNGVLHMRQVKYSDLDYNRHVNNAIYANIVCDLIPQEIMLHREPTRFGILYQKEATLGQILELEVVPAWSRLSYYVGGLVGGERCFEAEIQFA